MWERVNGNLWDELTDNICGSEPVVRVPSLAPIDSLGPSWLATDWAGAPLGATLLVEREKCIGGGGEEEGGHPWRG